MEPVPRFIQGTFPFQGSGLTEPLSLGPEARYIVPPDKRAQLIYLRGGNSSDALINLTLMRDGKVMRLFPLGARSAMHVPLAVVEDIFPESVLELCVSAPAGTAGLVVVDLGLLEAH